MKIVRFNMTQNLKIDNNKKIIKYKINYVIVK